MRSTLRAHTVLLLLIAVVSAGSSACIALPELPFVPYQEESCAAGDFDCAPEILLSYIFYYSVAAAAVDTTEVCTPQQVGGNLQGCGALSISGRAITFAGGTGGYMDGVGTAAQFNNPQALATDGTFLYIADRQNHRIRKIELSTVTVSTVAGDGSAAFNDATGTSAQFNFPTGMTTDGTNLYVADRINHRIRKIDIATSAVTTLAGNGSAGFMDGVGTGAQVSFPAGVTTDGTYVYVADTSNNRIRRIDIATQTVTTIAGDGTGASVDGTGTGAQFSQPAGIAMDGTNLYVSDRTGDVIRKIEIATTVVTTLAGSGTGGYMDGTGTAAQFDTPEGLVTDGSAVYVAEEGNNRVRRVDLGTAEVTTVAGDGTSAVTDGTGSGAQFSQPYGITSDGAFLYVSDGFGDTIRRLD